MENNVKEISHDVAVSLWKKAMLSVETECERQPEVKSLRKAHPLSEWQQSIPRLTHSTPA